MLQPQSEAMGRPAMGRPQRPRPRLEGRPNPALKPGRKSPYGDQARVVPRKLGSRAEAARRMSGGSNGA